MYRDDTNLHAFFTQSRLYGDTIRYAVGWTMQVEKIAWTLKRMQINVCSRSVCTSRKCTKRLGFVYESCTSNLDILKSRPERLEKSSIQIMNNIGKLKLCVCIFFVSSCQCFNRIMKHLQKTESMYLRKRIYEH